MKEQIIKLRSNGKTYDEIKEILGCSKSTISYHCGVGQKKKSLLRTRKYRKEARVIIRNRLDRFLSDRVHNFKRGGRGDKITNGKASYNAFFKRISDNPICYLTGREIDLCEPKTYNLDHIIPVAKKGENSLKNCGLSCRDANMAKSDMLLDEFIQLCKEVCENNGYNVTKK